MSASEGIMRLVSAVLFGGMGYLLSSKLPAPTRILSWVLFVLAILVADHVMISTRLIGIGDSGIYFNNALQGLGLGILCGFVVRGKVQAH
jgi:hypothetical protein